MIDLAERAPLLSRFVAGDYSDHSKLSVAVGLMGLGLLLLFFTGLVPLEIEVIEKSDLFDDNVFWKICIVFMVIAFPALTVAAFAVAVVMFWHVSMIIRFAVAVAMFLPAATALILGAAFFQGSWSDDLVPSVCALFCAVFVAAASVGIVFQMCTPWTLTHLRAADQALPRLGTRTLFELTTIIALTCAFVTVLDSDIPVIGLVTFGAVAAIGAVAGICSCMAFLRENSISKGGLIVALSFAFVMAYVFITFVASAEFGWRNALMQVLIVVPLAIFGTAIIAGLMAVCLVWLRRCGWRCVR